MYLTEPQKTALDLLKTYRCLRVDQLEQLLVMAYGKKDVFADRQVGRLLPMCRQLIRASGQDKLAMIGSSPDEDLLAAIDVMLSFRENGVEFHTPGNPPFKLTFFKNSPDGMLRAYYVAVIHRGTEYMTLQQARGTYKGKHNAAIFILDDLRQAGEIRFPYEHYHAVIKEGKVAFYKGVTSEI